jgi:multidrug efflux pump subunit AcrB
MYSILNFFVRQKKLALVFTLSIIIIGYMSALNIQRDRFPVVDFESMYVSTSYPGASPEDVEQYVTNPVEDEIRGITGIDMFTSVSREGYSRVFITLSQDIDDIKAVKQEIKDAVNRVRNLPEEVEKLPKVIDNKTSRKRILQINIVGDNSKVSYDKVRSIVDQLQKELKLINGVANVKKKGYQKHEVKIYLDNNKLIQHHISLAQVIQAINQRNIRYTAGTNHQIYNEKNIVVLTQFANSKDAESVVVKSSFDGPIIYLRDIAKIVNGKEVEKSIVRVNGDKGFILRVRKQEQADVIKTVNLVKIKIKDLQKKYPKGIKIFYTSDHSKNVRNRLDIITNNGILGLFLILIVLSIFLDIRTSFWVAVSLPVCLFGTVALLSFFGETINLISMAAMILVLGLVVDDSIIIAESIHSHKEKLGNTYQAVIEGFSRVILPVITTILTTIIAISSMFMMTGMMGKFIYVMPLVVIFALSLSFLEVTFALPAHLSGGTSVVKKREWFVPVERWFLGFIHKVLRFRYWVVFVFILIFIGSLYLAFNNMQFTLFPKKGSDTIMVKVELNLNSSLEETSDISKEVEYIALEVLGDDLDSISSEIGSRFNHIARIKIELKPINQRSRSTKEILSALKTEVKEAEIEDIKKIRFKTSRHGPRRGEDIEINLISPDNQQREAAAKDLEDILLHMDGVDGVERDDYPGKPRLELVIDQDKLSRFNIDPNEVNRYLRASYTGINATTIRYGSNNINFKIYLNEGENTEKFIQELNIANKKGMPIPAKNFISINELDGEPDINHYSGERSTVLSASVNDGTTIQRIVEDSLDKLNLEEKYPMVRYISEGGEKETTDSMNSFRNALSISVIGIFLLLVVLFNSYSQPLFVLLAIPFSAVGVIWAFFFHSEPLSFFAMMGSLALVGVVVNDSLVMVNHLNYIKKESLGKINVIKWVAQGSTDRLRAILLTTLTTLAGVIPMAYGIGGVDLMLQPMALALGYGLLFGTVITLILLPCFYIINDELLSWVKQTKISILRG